MRAEAYTFNGKDDLNIQVYKWLPDNNEVKAILQITHGSIEHAMRYRHFGEWLTEKGIGVYIHDQRGHGKTAGKVENVAFLTERDNGWELLIEEINCVTKTIKKEYPDKKIFLLGHSMGSFEVRDYASKFGRDIDGLLVCGTVPNRLKDKIQFKFARKYLKKQIKKYGKKYRSQKVHNMVYKELLLSRDKSIEEAYKADPYCGNLCTIDYINQMIIGVTRIMTSECFDNTPNDLPILIFSGEKDNVGGAKVSSVYDTYKKAGIKDVSLKIYEGAYHEVLNEINKEEVYEDIYQWINTHL
ncbi:MAG: lysophospholipase [Vallitalea sp.]|jgi:alpha-beta hydrolase superfamily lysophospholipase|nr:lysophospholipase [Vallitalea sp.]